MKASKFSDAQIAFVLKHAEDVTAVGEFSQKAEILQMTFKNCRKCHDGLMQIPGQKAARVREGELK